jgi:hypothetical protein
MLIVVRRIWEEKKGEKEGRGRGRSSLFLVGRLARWVFLGALDAGLVTAVFGTGEKSDRKSR